jgi:hypothetical protein
MLPMHVGRLWFIENFRTLFISRMFLWICRVLILSLPIAVEAQTFTATLSNVQFANGSFATGSFSFTQAGVISNSTVVITDPLLNLTVPLADSQDSHINIQNGFVVIAGGHAQFGRASYL